MRATRRTTTGDLRGDDAEGVCPYVVGSGALEGGALDKAMRARIGMLAHPGYVATRTRRQGYAGV
jgi:hypothetical protein